MRNMQGISLTGYHLHLLLASSMTTYSNGGPRNIPKLCEVVPKLIQEQCIQVWWIKTGLDFLLIHWLFNWRYIKNIWRKSDYHQTSITRKNHTSDATSWRPSHCPPWFSSPTKNYYSRHKIKYATQRPELKTSWKPEPQRSCLSRHRISLYPTSGSEYHKCICFDQFHNSTHRQMTSNGKSNTNQSDAYNELQLFHV